ncbi:MAG TPA: BON domain-containing protein [Gemmatimonadaceae bacterium]|nr:BON domain-containing protein [Gemmatimonadaceae bacterium]
MADRTDNTRDNDHHRRDYDYGADDVRASEAWWDYARDYPPPWFRHQRPRRGPYVGIGPKGYHRTDERIQEEISDRLMMHPDVDASDIEVHVANGIVTLRGTAEDRHQKRIAEFIAEDVAGVDDVNNELKARHGFWAGLKGERAVERVKHDDLPDVGAPSTMGSRINAARGAAHREEDAR